MRKAEVWLLHTKKLKQRNATAHTEWRQPGGPVGMRWVRARAAASPALRSHERVITSLTDTLSHFSASASMCLCLPPSLRLLRRISSHPWHTPVLAMLVYLCLSPHLWGGCSSSMKCFISNYDKSFKKYIYSQKCRIINKRVDVQEKFQALSSCAGYKGICFFF